MADALRDPIDSSTGTPAPPAIRRGHGLQLSTHAPADDRADQPPAEALASPPRRGHGLQLSTHAPAEPAREATAGEPAAPAWTPESAIAPPLRVRLAHGEVCYRQAGSGPPLLLIHGWGASSRYWFATQARLGDIRTCYALDLPGFGESPPLAAAGSVARLAALVIEYADALGLGRFDLNGHSFGAAVAAYVAAHWPERVGRVVITGFGVRRSAIERALLGLAHGSADLTLRFWQPWLNLGRPWLSQSKPLAELLMSAPPIPRMLASWYLDRIPDERLLHEGIVDFVRMDIGAHLACVASVGDPALIAALSGIQAPALFIGGDHDRVAPPADLATAAELAAGSRTVLLAQCGHVPMIEQPEAYHQALRSFLLGA